jgi:hypothetical protein
MEPVQASLMLMTLVAFFVSGEPAAPPDFSEQFDHADVTVSDVDAQIIAYDQEDQPIGSLALWVDSTGVTWLAADFADGYSLLGISPERGEVHRDQSLPGSVLAERAEMLMAYFEPAQPAGMEDNSWGECGWKAAAAGAACYFARPFACVGGAIKAGCACVPKLVKEFEKYECPWGL